LASLRHPAIRRWIDRFVAADPGLTALHRAVRTTLTVMCAVFTVYLALQALGFGTVLTIPLLAGVVSLMSSVAVNDPTPRQKQVTMLLLALVAIIFVFVGTVLGHYQVVKNVALLVIIFVAYYLRRFGPRFLALGMIGFMTFYFSSLIGTTLGQMPELIGAIAVGVGWAFVFVFLILPDRPARTVQRMLRSYDARTALVLDVLCAIVGGEKRDHALTKRLRHRLTRLNDTAMAIEGQLAGDAVDAHALGARPDRVRMFIFDALLSIETIAASVQYIVAHDAEAQDQANVDAALLATLRALRAAFHARDIRDMRSNLPELTRALDALGRVYDDHASGGDRQPWAYAVRRVESAGRWLVDDIAHGSEVETQRQGDGAGTDGGAGANGGAGTSNKPGGLRGKLQPTTIQAIQATVAGAIAIVLGYLLSPTHQYWTVLAAFVVLSNAGSIGKAYNRAFQRVAGTLLGAIVGFGLASLVAGSTRVEIVLAFVCIFCAFYLFSVAYGLMVFWVTVMLALMYDVLLGGINAQLLQVRFVDTLVGAAVALAMSMLILPTRSGDAVQASVRAFLTSLNGYVGRYLDELQGGRGDVDLIDEAVDLGAKLQQVMASTIILRKVAGAHTRSGVERVVATLLAVNYYAGHLTDPTARELALTPDQRTKALLGDAKENITANVKALIGRIDGDRTTTSIQDLDSVEELIEVRFAAMRSARPLQSSGTSGEARGGAAAAVGVQPPVRDGLVRSLHFIWHINQAIVDLAVDLGARRPETTHR